MNKPALITFALLLPVVAGARIAEPATSPPQACLPPAEMAALLPASREQAEDLCEDGDAPVALRRHHSVGSSPAGTMALERVRTVLRLLGRDRPAPGDAAR